MTQVKGKIFGWVAEATLIVLMALMISYNILPHVKIEHKVVDIQEPCTLPLEDLRNTCIERNTRLFLYYGIDPNPEALKMLCGGE